MGKEAFYASLCYQGIRGGAIYVDADSVVYKNQTLTIPEAYKNIVMPIKDIDKIEKGWLLFLPTVAIYLKNQKGFKFVIFDRKKFLENVAQYRDA